MTPLQVLTPHPPAVLAIIVSACVSGHLIGSVVESLASKPEWSNSDEHSSKSDLGALATEWGSRGFVRVRATTR